MRWVWAVLLVVAAASPAYAKPESHPTWPAELQSELLDAYRDGFKGEIHLYVKDLTTGVEFGHNAFTRTYIASVVKILFMIELFDQVERGEVSMDEYLEYKPEDTRGGAPLFNYLPVGAKLPLRAVVEAMIQQSDNAASDIIVRRVGIDRINAGIKARGYTGFGEITSLIDVRYRVFGPMDERVSDLKSSQIRMLDFARGPEARAAKLGQLVGEPGAFTAEDVEQAYALYYAAGANSATMRAVGGLLEDLTMGRVVSSSASAQMIDLLAGTQTGVRRMSGRLPPELRIAHKTGTQYRRTCDAGVLFLPNTKKVIFAACLKGSTGGRREEVIAQLAGSVYEHLADDPKFKPTKKKSKKKKKKKKKKGRKGAPAQDSSETDTL